MFGASIARVDITTLTKPRERKIVSLGVTIFHFRFVISLVIWLENLCITSTAYSVGS
jgi:hypothetical protein